MAISPQELENLRLFLNGQLPDAKAKDLKHKLHNDQAFHDEAKAYAKLFRAIEKTDPDRAKVKALVKATPFPHIPKIVSFQPILSAAAALAVLLVALAWVFLYNPSPVQYVDSEPEIDIVATSERAGAIPSAEKEFRNGNFDRSAKIFDELYRQDTSNMLMRYNYAVASLKAEDFLNAQLAFGDVFQSDDNLSEDAQFYLAWSYYLDNRKAESRKILNEIIQTQDHIKLDEAKLLLKKIEKK